MDSQSLLLSRRTALLFLSPALLFIAVFLVFPAIWVVFIGLTDLSLTGRQALHPSFVGLGNFARALSDPYFYNSLQVTVEFVAGSALIGQVLLGLILALLLQGRKGFMPDLVSNVVILAWIIPEVVVAYLWVAFLDTDFGLLNLLFGLIGLPRVNWFFEHPVLSIVIFNTWRGTAFSMLLFGAALQNVPPSHLETADVIGASWWQKFRDIILPTIKPHIVTDVLLVTIWTFNVFGPFLLTGGGPSFATDLISIYTYRNAFKYFQLGYGSSISVVILLINLLLAMIYLRISRTRQPG